MAGNKTSAAWMIKASIVSTIVFSGLFCYFFFTAPTITSSSTTKGDASGSMNIFPSDIPPIFEENLTDPLDEPNGCGNPTFTVQQWTIVNLPVALAIIIFFSFFQPRKSLWPDCCSGRPSVVYPVNLLDSYSHRLAFLCAFGIACLGILDLFTGNYYLEPNYDDLPLMVQGAVRTLMGYVNVCAIGLVHYPIMVCLTVEKWIISDIIGLLYTAEWSFMYYYTLAECPWNTTEESRVNNLIVIPIYICYVILIGIFIKRMRYNYNVRKKIRKGLEVEIHDYEEEFKKTHYYERVKYLFSSNEEWDETHQTDPGCCMKMITKFYKLEPGFRFSRRIICTTGLSALCLYCVGILYEASSWYIEKWARETFSLNGTLYEYYEGLNDTGRFYSLKEVGDTIAYTFSPTTFASMGTMIAYTLVFFVTYRRNTLRLWRGDRSFCPKEEFKNVTLVLSSLKYSGYQIAFVLWGFVLLQLTLWFLVFLFIYLLILPLINDEINWVWTIIKNQWLTVLVYAFVYFSQVFSAKYVFLQHRGKELNIDNRRFFHVQVYFFLFLNVLIGLASCLYRIFKSVLFGLLLVGRIDRCLLMRGFELYDTGYKSYLGFLQLEVAHTHPVVVTFCHFLLKDLNDRKQKVLEFSEDEEVEMPVPKAKNPRPRTRWFLALTLLRNNHLLIERFSAILDAKKEAFKHESKLRAEDEKVVMNAIEGFVGDDDSDEDVGHGVGADATYSSSSRRQDSKHVSSDDDERKIPEQEGSGIDSDPKTILAPLAVAEICNDSEKNEGSISISLSSISISESAKTSPSLSSPPLSTNTRDVKDDVDSGVFEKPTSAKSVPSKGATENDGHNSGSLAASTRVSNENITLPGTPLDI